MSIDITLKERGNNYGPFQDQGSLAQTLKVIVRESKYWSCLEPYKQEAIEMILHKISRIVNGNSDYIDSWHDIGGYAQLIERILKNDNR